MSSAILYLAIIAIWAIFLVPAWVRRPHADVSDGEGEFGADDEATFEHEAELEHVPAVHGEVEFVHDEGGLYDEGGMAEQEYRGDVPSHAGSAARPDPGTDGGADYRRPFAGPVRPSAPSQSREQMLRARRRMLTILASMTAVTLAFAVDGLVRWWICVPPAGMLVLYVLLLREIAMADAELARKREAWYARQAEEARQRERLAWAEAEAARDSKADQGGPGASGPGAQIIDISGRIGDQLYDQYADAAVRAVGD
ncbi:MAG TPA: hypothetical protein VF834_21180 [Streptosporangiaceae bacterium]